MTLVCFSSLRWGRTPLSDSVRLGNQQLANLLRLKGGNILESRGIIDICEGAALGDVKTIKLLVECAGIKVGLRFTTFDDILF
jgi:hypothetical protein